VSLVDSFFTNTYMVERSGPGSYENGFYVAGAKETIKVRGSMQPLNARELKLVEEGSRLKQYFKFYSDQPITTINTKTLNRADVITVDGDTYKVFSVESWHGTRVDLPYFKSIIYREPQQ